MKLIYKIIILFILLFTSSIFAQNRVGVFGGINSTDFSGDNPPNGTFSADLGYHIGVNADFYIVDDIAVNLQSMYSHRSTIIQYDVYYQYDKYDSLSVTSEYLEFPVSVKVIANNKMSYVTAGINLAVPINTIAINNRNGNQRDIIDQFESYIIYANFGVGIQFHIGSPLMFIELIYSQSLTNLTISEIKEITLNNKLKSNNIQLSTGILFTL